MTGHHAAISERWLLLIALLVGIAIGALLAHGRMNRLGEKADYWKAQWLRVSKRNVRQADRIRDLQDRCDYFEEQANDNARAAAKAYHPAGGRTVPFASYGRGSDN